MISTLSTLSKLSTLSTFLFVVMLNGCSLLPVPIQIASWVADGVSFIATEKSLSDHGLSMLVQKDCAVWRGLKHGVICQENIDPSPLVASKNNVFTIENET